MLKLPFHLTDGVRLSDSGAPPTTPVSRDSNRPIGVGQADWQEVRSPASSPGESAPCERPW